jgi:hypothetical protein
MSYREQVDDGLLGWKVQEIELQFIFSFGTVLDCTVLGSGSESKSEQSKQADED